MGEDTRRRARREPHSGKRRPVWTASSPKTRPKLVWRGPVDLSTISNRSTTYPEEVLSRVLYATQFTRHLDKHGYVRFRNWRFFGEDGLAGEEVSVWVYEETLKVEYQTTALALYSLTFQPDHEQIAKVTQARRIQTPFRSPQLDLWQLSETEWLLALRRPDPAPRQNRGKIIPLARQLPLLDVSATG